MKKVERSKTLWLGSLTCLVSILTFLQGNELITKYPTTVSAIGLITGILIIICRFLTTEPLSKPRTMNRKPKTKK